jgi:methylase of polypeptide subunit release factors
MSGTPYLSSEDSALLRSALQRRSGESCLEIGAGNGGNLVDLSKRFALVVGTDLAKPSMEDWREAGAEFVLADGASCLRPSVFDLVVFNPPYLDVDATDDVAVEGGRNLEVPKKFLRDAIHAVKNRGEVVFLLNDEARIDEFEEVCSVADFHLKVLASKRVFFEELTVYSAYHGAGTKGTLPSSVEHLD